MQRNQSVDLIKVVAMLMVVMLHLGLARVDENFDSPNLPIGPFAGVAIPLFFMVSGYLLSTKNPCWRYNIKKIWGIIRFCLYICIPMSIVMSITSRDLQLLFPECLVQKGRLYQFWYFGSMLIVYALLPYLLFCIKHRLFKYILAGGAILCSISVLLCVCCIPRLYLCPY